MLFSLKFKTQGNTMKLITKVAAALFLTSTYAMAYTVTGTVQSILQKDDGRIIITVLRTSDGKLIENRYIDANDLNKKEKLALAITAKSMGSELEVELITGGILGEFILH